MSKILFACTANRYRSPIAEACFKAELIKRGQDQVWDVSSAGTWTQDGQPAMSDAIQKAGQMGLDIQAHRSQVITEALLQETDIVVVMEQGQKEALQSEFFQQREKILLLSEATSGLSYSIPDPVIEKDVGNVPKEICDLIQKYYDKMITFLDNLHE